jgi:hypothetical protein
MLRRRGQRPGTRQNHAKEDTWKATRDLPQPVLNKMPGLSR